ncbi:MAG: DinB family protein [Fimbriimonadaceae bacterium]|nr:DinB family protein [Fimbriimonadaceae bacterium]
MSDVIDRTKEEFLRAKAGIERALATTPDDRINWSPAPTARTPIQLVAHAAWAVQSMHGMLQGQTFAVPTTAQADREFREWEKPFSTREEVLKLLEENSLAFLNWLENVGEWELDSTITFPFGMGEAPMHTVLPFMAGHIDWHTAQIAYIQTVYGDQDWHM